MYGCLSLAPHWEPGLQPRYVPWLGIQPATLWFTVQHSIHWATPARAWNGILKTQLQHHLGGSTLQVWGNVLQGVLHILNQYPTNVLYFFSHNQDSPGQVSRSGSGSGTMVTPLSSSKIFSVCCHNPMLCWSRDLSSKGRNASTRRQWFHGTGSEYCHPSPSGSSRLWINRKRRALL